MHKIFLFLRNLKFTGCPRLLLYEITGANYKKPIISSFIAIDKFAP